MRRDHFNLFENENFAVVFDTFHDKRNGYMFYTTPLGGLFDGLITDETNINRDWNTVWDAKAARDDLLRDRVGEVRVVAARIGVRADVLDLVAGRGELLHELLLEPQTAVVGRDDDFHDQPSKRESTSEQFVPPKPNELLSACFTRRSRATSGT